MFTIKVQPPAFSGSPVSINNDYLTIKDAIQAYSQIKNEISTQGVSFYRQNIKNYHPSVLRKETSSKGGFILICKKEIKK